MLICGGLGGKSWELYSGLIFLSRRRGAAGKQKQQAVVWYCGSFTFPIYSLQYTWVSCPSFAIYYWDENEMGAQWLRGGGKNKRNDRSYFRGRGWSYTAHHGKSYTAHHGKTYTTQHGKSYTFCTAVQILYTLNLHSSPNLIRFALDSSQNPFTIFVDRLIILGFWAYSKYILHSSQKPILFWFSNSGQQKNQKSCIESHVQDADA